jgi:4-oxalocrotonate tautomerase
MPHVVVKLWPGKTEAQKAKLAEAIARDVIEHLGSSEASVSVSIEEVPQEAWAEQVYRPDIAGRPELVYRKPGYSM